MHFRWLTAAVACLACTACGGTATTEPSTPDPTPPSPAEPPAIDSLKPPDTPWDQLSFDERKKYMGDHVLPAVGAWFEQYDPERFAGFSCDGCHGPDMVARKFAMPNPSIMALHPTGTEEQKQMVRDHPEMVKFMFNKVLPATRTLLGAAPYDAETQQGFSCYACHPSAAEGS